MTHYVEYEIKDMHSQRIDAETLEEADRIRDGLLALPHVESANVFTSEYWNPPVCEHQQPEWIMRLQNLLAGDDSDYDMSKRVYSPYPDDSIAVSSLTNAVSKVLADAGFTSDIRLDGPKLIIDVFGPTLKNAQPIPALMVVGNILDTAAVDYSIRYIFR